MKAVFISGWTRIWTGRLSGRKGGVSWRSSPGVSLWPPVQQSTRTHTHTNTCKYLLKGENSTPSHSFKHMYGSKVRSSCRGSEKAAALIISYLQPLGQQLGILRSFVLVLLRALSLKGDAAAFVLQHTGCHQALDFRGLGPGLLA